MGLIDLVFGDRNERRRALLERARAYLRGGRVDKALLLAERALRLDPDGAEARETIGWIQFRLAQLAWTDGDVEAALECYTQASRFLGEPQVLFYRGLCYRDAKQFLKAIEDFSRVLRSEETQALPFANYATFCRGLCYREMGEYKHAVKDFTTCIEMEPESPLRHRYLAHRAVSHAARGDFTAARADIHAAEVLEPDASEVALFKESIEKEQAAGASHLMPANRPAAQLPAARNEPSIVVSPELLEMEDLAWPDDAEIAETSEVTPVEEPSWLLGTPYQVPETSEPEIYIDEDSNATERLATLREKREQALAERAILFGDHTSPLEPDPAFVASEHRPAPVPEAAQGPARTAPEPPPDQTGRVHSDPSPSAAAAGTTPLATVPSVRPRASQGNGHSSALGEPPPREGPTRAGARSDAAVSEDGEPTARALRCLEKLREMLSAHTDRPDMFNDLDLCVDYLLVAARARELSPSEKLTLAAALEREEIAQLEKAESRALDRLLATPNAGRARLLAQQLVEALEDAPPPSRIKGTPHEKILKDVVHRFEDLSRAQKYLFLDACGRKRFGRFSDYWIALGSGGER